MAKIATVYLYAIKRKKDGRLEVIGHRCGCSALHREPGLFLCRNCKAAVEAGAELRIYARFRRTGDLKKYRSVEIEIWTKYGVRGWYGRVLGGFQQRDIEIGECRSKKALLECALKLIQDREREEAMATLI